VAAQLDRSAAGRDENRHVGLGPHAAALLDKAGNAIRLERLDEAGHTLAAASTLAPNHPEVVRLRGVVEHLRKRYPEAVALLRRAAELKPDDALIQNNLGSALGESGDIEGALAAFRRSCELAPGLAATWFNLGRALESQGQTQEAESVLARALALEPGHLQARIMHGHVLRVLGRIDDAVAEYRHTLALQPDFLPALSGLTNLKTVALLPEERRALGRIYARRDLGPTDRAMAGFALMHALEDVGREREAFAIALAANATLRRQVEWDAPFFSRIIDAIATAFGAMPRSAAPPQQGEEVIFIVSMPRSGSTLTEQILAAHPQVEGANELEVMPDLLREESVRRGVEFPLWVGQATPGDWDRLGKLYLERTGRWRQARPRFTDKGLSNWQHVGAIRAMLPGARIVECRRDPVETCLSCFRQVFNRGHGYAYDMDELAAFWRDYDRLSRFWQAHLPGAVHTLVYEDLLARPEQEIRRLLDACGLPFDPACLSSHEIERNVRSASASQVREPLRSDTARAALYGDLLVPLRRALGVA